MPTVRTFVFRVYPNEAQQQRLRGWEGACRFLYNLAHQQRLMGLLRLKGAKVYPTAFGQAKELTELRADVPWLGDVPRHVAQRTLDRLGEAWDEFFAKQGGRPSFKKRGGPSIALEEFDPKVWRLDAAKGVVRFPKLGNVPVVLHRHLEGKAKTCALVRDIDQWFVHITCEVTDVVPAGPLGPPVAIDLGVEVAFADSEGGLVPNPRVGEAMAPKIAHLQRQVTKKQKGSKNRAKAKEKVARAQRKLRRQREHFAHTYSFRYAKSHGVIVLEDLRLKNMTASAKGTVEERGTNVAQKAGLNRALLDVAMHRFATLLTYKARKYGGQVVRVPAAYSSQECAECGHIAAENRPTRSRFHCQRCGHQAHADTNAARVLLTRYVPVEPAGEAVCRGTPRTGPMKQKSKTARSRTSASKRKGLKSPGLQAVDGLPPRAPPGAPSARGEDPPTTQSAPRAGLP